MRLSKSGVQLINRYTSFGTSSELSIQILQDDFLKCFHIFEIFSELFYDRNIPGFYIISNGRT